MDHQSDRLGGWCRMIAPLRHQPDATDTDAPAMIVRTIAADDAGRIVWDFVVIGAGPAGSATALRLARRGLRVLLVDRGGMPRPKICGCCLSTTALFELRALGLHAGHVAPVPLTAVLVAAAGRTARLPLPESACLSREALDTALVREAIAAGVHWLPGVTISGIAESAREAGLAGVTVLGRTAADDESDRDVVFRAHAAVIAAGLADHVRITVSPARAAAAGKPAGSDAGRRIAPHSRIGVGATLPAAAIDPHRLPPGMLVMAVSESGYCGLVRLEDGRVDLAAAIDRADLAGRHGGDPATAVAAILRGALGDAEPSSLRTSIAATRFRATPALTHQSPLVAGAAETIYRVGDAAGYVEPFTGEGMGWALAGARILAESVASSGPAGGLDAAATAARYRAAHGRHFARHHRRCLRVSRALRHPLLVAGAVRLARMLPWAAGPVLPLLVGARRRQPDEPRQDACPP
jgi:menaquinone-9 beta-reductase